MRGRIPTVHRWRDAVAPALIVTTPLLGYSLLGDDRRRLYLAARRFGSDPLAALSHSLETVDGFLDRGNFRPLGRAIENIERGFVFDAAEATGLAPHAVTGVLRLTMIALLALVAGRVVWAVMSTAGASAGGAHPAVVMYPMALAATLVAADHDSPITKYPFVVVGSVVLALVCALSVARDQDMRTRPLSWHEPVLMAVLGAVAASTYDLLYLAPGLAAVFMAARHAASGRPARELLHTAALRRWAWLCVGFGAVFVPVRIEIANRCSQTLCYSASEIELSAGALGRSADRLLTGAPPAGWSYTSDLLDESGLSFGLAELATNGLLVLLVAAIGLIGVRSARQTQPGSRAVQPEPSQWRRPAASLGALGAATALLPALLAGLSRHIQQVRYPIGEAWRDTVLVQVGWSFMATAALVALFGVVRSRRASQIVAVAVSAILCGALVLTLLANARLNRVDRNTPLHAVTNEIAAATIHFDPTEGGNARRCRLVDNYTLILPDPDQWVGGPNVRIELDQLMLDRHGVPFCDPARVAEFDQ